MLKHYILGGLVLLWPLAVRAEQVTLRIDNIPSEAAAQDINRALAQIPGVNVSEKATRDKPAALVAFDPAKADVGDLARAVAGVKTAAAEKPSARLVLGYRRFDDSLLEDAEIVSPRVKQALAKLKGKGVDSENWKLEAKSHEVHIRLEEQGGAKLADITAAFPTKDDEFPLVKFTVK